MSIFDWFTGNGQRQALLEAQEEIEELKTDLAIRTDNMSLFQERLAELELQLKDQGWQVLSGASNREFSRYGLRIINGLARIYFLKNPLVRRAVLTQTQYVFGQGMNISAKHPLINDVVQEFLDDRKNRAELTEHQALMIKETELQCFANVFFVFFVDKYKGHVRVRTIPVDEITEIVSNPEDAKEPWYYHRVWSEIPVDVAVGTQSMGVHEAYYPDWRYKPDKGHPANLKGKEVMVDTPVYHVAVNRLSDMKFGVSEIYASLDWAKAYKEYLENWSTIEKAYARFAWRLSTKGGAAGVAAAKVKLASTLSSSSSETNPPPATGSTFIASEGINLEPMKRGVQIGADDSRYLRLMVSSATGIFEHYLTGDPSTGNLATAKAMEFPMLIMFRDRQQLWVSVLTEILNFVIDEAVRGGRIPGTIEKDEYGEEMVVLANDKDNENPDLRDYPIDRTVEVEFKSILENTEDRIKAIVAAATLEGKPMAGTMALKLITRLLLEALGLDDIDAVIDEMFPPEEQGEEESLDIDTAMKDAFTKAIAKLAEYKP